MKKVPFVSKNRPFCYQVVFSSNILTMVTELMALSADDAHSKSTSLHEGPQKNRLQANY